MLFSFKKLIQVAVVAIFGSSLITQGLALPLDVSEVSENNSLEARGVKTGILIGGLGAHIYHKAKKNLKEAKEDAS